MHQTWIDRLGGLASTTCAVHCGLLTFSPALVAALEVQVVADEALEWGLFAFALALATVAAAHGYRNHRSGRLVFCFVLGGVLLAAARLGEAWSLFEGAPSVSIVAGGMLVAAHIANARSLQACHEVACE